MAKQKHSARVQVCRPRQRAITGGLSEQNQLDFELGFLHRGPGSVARPNGDVISILGNLLTLKGRFARAFASTSGLSGAASSPASDGSIQRLACTYGPAQRPEQS